jgi:hypothetical protein
MHTAAACGEQLVEAVRGTRVLVGALHTGALDGWSASRDRYTSEDVRWAHEQLSMIDSACLRGGDVEAAWRIEAVLERLKHPALHLPVRPSYGARR